MEYGDVVTVKNDDLYPTIGVLNSGRGTFKRADLQGSATSYRQLFRVAKGDVIFSKLKAFEGAIAIVPSEHDRHFVSSEFPTFTIAESVSKEYISHALRSEFFESQLRKASRGLGARRERVHPRDFLQIGIPLPGIDEQRAIAARLDATLGVADSSDRATAVLGKSLTSLLIGLFHDSHQLTPLSQLLQETKRFEPLDPASWYSSAGVRWYAEGVFARDSKPANEFKSTQLNRLQAGEFIYNRLFAWKGSFALVPDQLLHASNEFPTFSINETQIMPEYLLGWFSLPAVWGNVLRLSTGATPTSRNRFKQEQLLQLQIPLPPMGEQESVVHTIRQLRRAQVLNSSRKRIANALPQAARNAEFARLMS